MESSLERPLPAGESANGAHHHRWSARPQPLGPSRFMFPPPAAWPAQDLVALGGDLDPGTIIAAYRQGIFPMTLDARERQPVVGWWSPDPRGILPLDHLRVTRSMRRSFKQFDVRTDTCFGDVIRACANPSREDG